MQSLRRTPHARWPAWLLVAAIALAQWLLVQHEVQVAQHPADHACEWCLTHAPLVAGGTPAVLPALAFGSAVFLFNVVFSVPVSAPRPVYLSRAPPSVLPA